MSNSVVGPGEIIAGRYRIERLLGQGAMGSVYEALQLSLQRRVALKLLVDEHLEHPAHVARFEREAVALARLTDPHTVRLFDFGTDERRRPFLVMELLEGCDLADHLARHGPLRWDRALLVSRQVLGSLAEAHGAGTIHRDIKPANLFLCAGPEWPVIKVLDFGVAAATERDRSTRKLTLTGTVVGSAPYMSPEQAQGQEAGPGADLYALGVVLFELLTRSTPFQGRTFTAQLLAKVMEPAPSLRDACPELDVPDGVQALVAELLERDAATRPASARAVAERMTALLEGVSLPALARAVDAAPVTSQPLTPLSTEPMPIPPTLDNCWAPPAVAPPVVPFPPTPLHEARRVARTTRGRLALAASALLVSVGALGWQLRPSAPADGAAMALEPTSASPALGSSAAPLPDARVEVSGESVLASAADTSSENEAAPSGSEPAPAASGATRRHSPPPRKPPKVSAPAHARAPRAAPAAKAPELAATGPVIQAAVPPVPALPDGLPVWRADPSPTALQLPRAAAPPEPAEQPREMMRGERNDPAASDDVLAALSERRQFARSRAIRQFRERLIDHSELAQRLREIDREFSVAPRWLP
jgi:serine/threonine-protein kinase